MWGRLPQVFVSVLMSIQGEGALWNLVFNRHFCLGRPWDLQQHKDILFQARNQNFVLGLSICEQFPQRPCLRAPHMHSRCLLILFSHLNLSSFTWFYFTLIEDNKRLTGRPNHNPQDNLCWTLGCGDFCGVQSIRESPCPVPVLHHPDTTSRTALVSLLSCCWLSCWESATSWQVPCLLWAFWRSQPLLMKMSLWWRPLSTTSLCVSMYQNGRLRLPEEACFISMVVVGVWEVMVCYCFEKFYLHMQFIGILILTKQYLR